MYSLRELQTAFADAVFQHDEGPLLACCAGDPARAAQALQVYREGVLTSLTGALTLGFPLVGRIVGDDFLRAVARRYALTRPSRSGDLNRYGGDFADFLADFAPLAELPYLADVARLEWAIQQVGAAADAAAPDLSRLAATAADDWGELCFELIPAHAVLVSVWPLYDIWRVNQPTHHGSCQVDFSLAQSVLVSRRPDAGVVVTALETAEAAFVRALDAGCSLYQALSVVPDTASFDLQSSLSRLIGLGLIGRVHC
ncbi:DNA-binding domain-containing protein [Paludibacterium purpuratum]|uniref:Putative DNA-binding protein n=1 Tax=Paludibacterium purpuratum TaxID=1144873 RepID=A0A4R7B6Q6_9NEIS|nr:DNA-binding domain-containing protein [Paludibacterium purpuratum]TDR80394.1 putative DNA-binding protein [Paludibacterium purpuratum]